MPKNTHRGIILIHPETGGVLCKDGMYRRKAAGAQELKVYKSIGWAEKTANKLLDRYGESATMRFFYDDEVVDCCGNIHRETDLWEEAWQIVTETTTTT